MHPDALDRIPHSKGKTGTCLRPDCSWLGLIDREGCAVLLGQATVQHAAARAPHQHCLWIHSALVYAGIGNNVPFASTGTKAAMPKGVVAGQMAVLLSGEFWPTAA